MNALSKYKDLKFMDYVNKKTYIKRLLQFIIGCFMVSLAFNIFIAPSSLIPGGVGGIAIILNYLLGINNSLSILIMCISLLIVSFFLLGTEKTKSSVIGTILFPTFVALTENINIWLKIDTSNILLSAIFGGILYGFGAGLVFKAGFTNGGTDILNQIISKYAKISIGKSMLFSDGLIVLLSGFIFGVNTLMYSIIVLYIISLISDRVVLGISDSKMFYIITERDEEVKNYILKYLNHGVTIFNAKGGYKKSTEKVLMTVLPTKDYYRLKEGIKKIDKNAFFIVTDSYEVFGGE